MQGRFYLVLLLISVLAGVAAAQNSAPGRAINGTVLDTSGAVIPGAQIVIATPSGQTVAQGTTDNAGNFSFTNIAVGSYLVDVTKEKFRETKQPTKIGSQVHSSCGCHAGCCSYTGSDRRCLRQCASGKHGDRAKPGSIQSTETLSTESLCLIRTTYHNVSISGCRCEAQTG